ncbi:helix-turn-helix transcriptional regulator [Fangia hongkongensis]|uniref:helix-turn-helix transcriptional regulator n=2 Tax=Fangia hongkongensis TaxID=270495 RepID=UPI0003A4010A|nr:helix-turn-helix transcriptional regulator [Fangia hongkongensis]
MARENTSRYAILCMINKHPISGYKIKMLFSKIANFYWSESNAQIYPMLKKLEEEGLVQSSFDPQAGKRKTRIYSITSEGKSYLNKWLCQPITYGSKERNELLLKLSNGFAIDQEHLSLHVQHYLNYLQLLKTQLYEVIEHIKTDHHSRQDQPYLLMVYNYNDKRINAEIQWAEETLSTIQTID